MGPPRDRDCSLNVCVLVGLGEREGRGAGLGETVSFLNRLGLEGSFGGVLLERSAGFAGEGIDEWLLLDDEELD